MKKVKFNRFERLAGVFVLSAMLLGVLTFVSVAIKQGWFESQTEFQTVFVDGDGIHAGTLVQIAGLKAGAVDQVELTPDNQISVRFHVLTRFARRIREDSHTQLIRPFIIGERVLEIVPGSEEANLLQPGSLIASKETLDLMTLMSGRKLGDYLGTLSDMLVNVKRLAEAFLGGDRTDAMIRIFDRIDPLLKNLNTMSVEVTRLSRQGNKDNRFGTVMRELAVTTKELNGLLPQVREQAPEIGKNLTSLIQNLTQLTDQFKVLMPAFTEIAPELPQASRRALEALDEAVVLIKAMQKSFFVRGGVEEVREEEESRKAQRAREEERKPASKSQDPDEP